MLTAYFAFDNFSCNVHQPSMNQYGTQWLFLISLLNYDNTYKNSHLITFRLWHINVASLMACILHWETAWHSWLDTVGGNIRNTVKNLPVCLGPRRWCFWTSASEIYIMIRYDTIRWHNPNCHFWIIQEITLQSIGVHSKQKINRFSVMMCYNISV